MRIHYDPRSSSLMYFMKRQGLSPGAIYQSADESTPSLMFIKLTPLQVRTENYRLMNRRPVMPASGTLVPRTSRRQLAWYVTKYVTKRS